METKASASKDETSKVTMCNRVKELREKAGLSVYMLGQRTGFYSDKGSMTTRGLHRLEAGENCTVETALRLFAVLKDVGVCEKFEDVFWLENFDIDRNVSNLQKIKDEKKQAKKDAKKEAL